MTAYMIWSFTAGKTFLKSSKQRMISVLLAETRSNSTGKGPNCGKSKQNLDQLSWLIRIIDNKLFHPFLSDLAIMFCVFAWYWFNRLFCLRMRQRDCSTTYNHMAQIVPVHLKRSARTEIKNM